MAQTVPRLLDAVYRFCIWGAGASIVVMSLIVPWGVFTRYVLGTGSNWPEPIAIMLMVIFTFLGTAASYRAGAHIAVAMLTDRLPPAMQKGADLIANLIMAAVCIFVVVWGTKLVMGTWGQSLDSLPWLPVGATYAPLPIGSFLTLLFVLERIFIGPQWHRPIVSFGDAAADFEAEVR
jgi:TRAP-type C4-dicarboxylate transport system permease small subunit